MKILQAIVLGVVLSTGTITGCESLKPVQVEYTKTLENELMQILSDANAVVATANSLVVSGVIVPGSTVYNKLDSLFQYMNVVADQMIEAIQLQDVAKALASRDNMKSTLLAVREVLKETEAK